MPYFAVVIIGALASALPSLVFRILASLGVGLIVFTGIGLLLDQVSSFVNQNIGALSDFQLISQFAGFFMIDKHISIILSALSIKVTLIGLDKATGALTKIGR